MQPPRILAPRILNDFKFTLHGREMKNPVAVVILIEKMEWKSHVMGNEGSNDGAVTDLDTVSPVVCYPSRV